MQGSPPRLLILAALLAVGIALLANIGAASADTAARWPSEDAFYAVDGWAMSAGMVDGVNGAQFISRNYAHSDGSLATLVVSTSPAAKAIYRAGAEVPFLGSGYAVEPAPPSLARSWTGGSAFVVSKENEAYLLLYAYGERRGLLGNGPLAWGAATLDAVLGNPNDYFRATILVPLSGNNPATAEGAIALADALFPRLATWYGA